MALVWHPVKVHREPVPITTHIKRLDPLGTFFFVPGIVCLLLALQWGGSTYAWNNGRIIALFVLFGVLMMAFVSVQILMPETATIPARIITQRSILASTIFTFCGVGSMMMTIYFMPIWCKCLSRLDIGYHLLIANQTSSNRQTSRSHEIRNQHSPPRPKSSRRRLHRRRHHKKVGLLRPGNDPLSMHPVRRPRSPIHFKARHQFCPLDCLPNLMWLRCWHRNADRRTSRATHPPHVRCPSWNRTPVLRAATRRLYLDYCGPDNSEQYPDFKTQ